MTAFPTPDESFARLERLRQALDRAPDSPPIAGADGNAPEHE
jgi:hypothetical protein